MYSAKVLARTYIKSLLFGIITPIRTDAAIYANVWCLNIVTSPSTDESEHCLTSLAFMGQCMKRC